MLNTKLVNFLARIRYSS